uniref:Ribosomal-protein-alanine N-acetyltransferase n=1 Tax=Ignisphaera aggregans TaxID=334771 RepID=A0A7J3QEB0_9CREN
MNIRKALQNDLQIVFELEKKCFNDPYPIELLTMLYSLYPELFLVAEYNNKIVGYVSGLIRTDGFGHIVSLCVDPEHRRKGIGKQLMLKIEESMKKLFNVCLYRLEVRVSNSIAILLYESIGYRIQARIPKYYSNGEDAYLMIKDIC